MVYHTDNEKMKHIYLLTSGDGSDGNEWGVFSIHSSLELAALAKEKYETPIKREDGSTYIRESKIEEWAVDECPSDVFISTEDDGSQWVMLEDYQTLQQKYLLGELALAEQIKINSALPVNFPDLRNKIGEVYERNKLDDGWKAWSELCLWLGQHEAARVRDKNIRD